MLTLQQMRVIVALSECGSLASAAAKLGYGTPTVTHHLNVMERALEGKLVERSSRGAQLTPMGVAVAEESRLILDRTAHLERTAAAIRTAGVPTLRIGTFASSGGRLLPPAIRRLQATHGVRVEVVEAEPTALMTMLLHREIHCGLIYDFADDPSFSGSELELTPLRQEPYGVLVSAKGEFAARDRIDFNELRDMSWVFARHEDESPGRALMRACRAAGFLPKEFMQTDDLMMIHGIVAEGLALAVVPDSATVEGLGVRLKPSVQPLGSLEVSFAMHPDFSPAAAVSLRDILLEITR